MANAESIESQTQLKNIFKVNQRLEILVVTGNDLYEQYKSRIEETHPDYLVVAMPMSKGAPVSLKSGEIFSGRLPSGTMTYEFSSRYIERKLSPLPVWIISWPFNVTKMQQRAFVRMDIMLPAFLSIKSDNKSPDQDKLSVFTKDLSGGGLQVIMDNALEMGTKVQITVNLPESGMFSAIGEVIRIQKPQSDRPLFWVGIKFIDIQEKDRSNIIKFIFKKQLEQRRKEI